MKELAQIRAAVLKALQESGIPAMEQFPEKRAESYSGAVATVGVGAASGKNAGFCNRVCNLIVFCTAICGFFRRN